jgi:hypothetical protein
MKRGDIVILEKSVGIRRGEGLRPIILTRGSIYIIKDIREEKFIIRKNGSSQEYVLYKNDVLKYFSLKE